MLHEPLDAIIAHMFMRYIFRHRIAYMPFVLLLCCVVSMLWPQPAHADVVDLYVGEVDVNTRQEEERRVALGRALMQVLIRLTGKPWLGETDILKSVLEDAEPYMRSYQYRSVSGVDDVERIVLSVTFERRFLRDLMEVEGLSLWPASRPGVAIWAAFQDGSRESILNTHNTPEVAEAINHYNHHYGMSAHLPIGDIQDSDLLSVKDILGTDKKALRRASERYLVDGILVGALSGGDIGGWVARWQYFESTEEAERNARKRLRNRSNRERTFFSRERNAAQDEKKEHHIATSAVVLSCRVRAECVLYGLDALRELLVSRESVIASELGEGLFLVRIEDVKTYQDYKDVLQYLEQLSLTEFVFPVEFEPDTVVYQVGTHRSMRSLYDALERERRLELVSEVDLENIRPRDIQLTYLWRK